MEVVVKIVWSQYILNDLIIFYIIAQYQLCDNPLISSQVIWTQTEQFNGHIAGMQVSLFMTWSILLSLYMAP